jgi:hypothetical protein
MANTTDVTVDCRGKTSKRQPKFEQLLVESFEADYMNILRTSPRMLIVVHFTLFTNEIPLIVMSPFSRASS